MNTHFIRNAKIVPFFANSNDALIPEVWAQEALMILESNMVMGNLVHRDFENEVASVGDVVNTRQPASFTAARKGDGDDVTVQDAQSTNVAVPLNQHLHTSFIIYDGEESKSMTDLIALYLKPGVLSIAESVDQILAGQAYQFVGNAVGKIGTALTRTSVVSLKEQLDILKVPQMGRNLVLTASQQADLLDNDNFTNAEKIGDTGTALREGSLGRKFGFDIFMDQNMPSIAAGNTSVTGAINNAAGYVVGTTSLTVDGFSAAITNGAWCTVDGQPYMITSTTGGSTPTVIVVSGGLRAAVADDAVVKVYTPGAINLGAGYAAAWYKAMVVDGFSVAPKSQQLITFGTTIGNKYSALGTPTTTSLTLNRPLDALLADDAVIGIGPAGQYGLGFHRNAMALVTRPLARPRAGTGAASAVASYNGLSMRATITYNGTKQGHLVTLDILCGTALLNSSLGAVLLA